MTVYCSMLLLCHAPPAETQRTMHCASTDAVRTPPSADVRFS